MFSLSKYLEKRKETKRVVALAKEHNINSHLYDMYIYAMGLDLGYTRYQDWGKYAGDHDFAGYPVLVKGEWIATYKLERSYYRSDSSRSDLAGGDSGKYGDFVLLRVDRIPRDYNWEM